ncbi:MAG: hypothetical protein RLZZ347_682, partial [Candidatus Parcubacteria bacterium]
MSVIFIQNKGVQKSKGVFLFGSVLLIVLSVLFSAPKSTHAAGVDVYLKVATGVVTDTTFTGDGSASNPYGAPAGNIDTVMNGILNPSATQYVLKNQPVDTKVAIHLANGTYLTAGYSTNNGCGVSNGCPSQWLLPSNTSIIGESRDATVIRLSEKFFTNPASKGRLGDILVIRGDGGWNTKTVPKAEGIQNLTIDANYATLVALFNTTDPLFSQQTPSNKTRVGGVWLFGEGNFVDTVRIKDIGNYYGAGVMESFGALLQLSDAGVANPAVRYNINCTASPTDTNCSRIVNSIYEEGNLHPSLKNRSGLFTQETIFNITGSWNSNGVNNDPADPSRKDVFMNGSVIANNTITFTNTDGEHNSFQGYSVHHTYGGKVFGNTAQNIAMGYYSDWWQDYNLEIYNNQFSGVSIGVDVKTDALPNFKKIGYNIHDNTIAVIPINDGARAGIRILRNNYSTTDGLYYPPSPYVRELSNFRIANNRINFVSAPSGAFANSALFIGEVSGLDISNNVFDSRFNQSTSALEEAYRYFFLPPITSNGILYRDAGVSVSGNTNTSGTNVDCLLKTTDVYLLATTTHQTKCATAPALPVSSVVCNSVSPTQTAINVKDFGAVGNGAVDDRQAIQNAFDCAVSLSSNTRPLTVAFPAGTYAIRSSHPTDGSYQDLELGSWDKVTAVSLDGSVATDGTYLSELVTSTSLQNANANGRALLAVFGKNKNFKINHLSFASTQGNTSTVANQGLYLVGGANNEIANFEVSGNRFKNFSLELGLSGVLNGKIFNNQFLMEKGRDSGTARMNFGLPNVGLWAFSNANGSNNNLEIYNNTYDGCADSSFNLATQSTSHLCGDGFIFGQPKNALIHDNQIKHFSFEGINVGNGNNGALGD